MRKNKIQNILFKQAETSRQFMVLGAVLFLTGLMSVNILGIIKAGTTDNTNIALNVSAGALSLDSAPSQINFGAAGVGAVSSANSGTSGAANAITVNDTSGSGAGWDLTAYYNTNFTSVGASEMSIDATNEILGDFSELNIINITGQTGDVQQGADANFEGTASGNAETLATAAADNGQGCFNLFNLKMNYTIPMTADATDYTTQMIFTVA